MSSDLDALSLQNWLKDNKGTFNNKVRFQSVPSGYSVIASEEISENSTIVTCPIELAVTKHLSKSALLVALNISEKFVLDSWNERQCIASYLSLHRIVDGTRPYLQHGPYVRMLPDQDKMRTGLHFTPEERELFRGSNIFGAIADRENECKEEWAQCAKVITEANADWGAAFTWDLYLTATTHISSRAFPSSLLSRNPTLVASSSTEPILLPGIDSLNHGRGKAVSWTVSYPTDSDKVSVPTISLITHYSSAPGDELLNNYGPKPNAELILGYGFSIPENPDDTILLKVGGGIGSAGSKRWEVGRRASGADGLWDEVVSILVQDGDGATYEDHLDAASMLEEMVEQLIARLPPLERKDFDPSKVRPEVVAMYHDYIEGQRDILDSLLQFAENKKQAAIEWAAKEGVELVFED